ncbi:hypothetical protein RJ639_014939 [Escallonia herrerae]|uniref:Uncharacterized protein n=1 Tax=Escallonia herrerae TaxID=1293975 RepID=A0AA88VHX9_9ASTE|nr:hypothetical protein RJ639_014939 [Escallonia herrerae]
MAPNTLTKYDLEKVDGFNDFSLWRMKMRAVLIQQGLSKALKEKQGLPDTMSADEKKDMLERAYSALLLWKKKDNSKTADAGVAEDNSDGADVPSVTISSSDGGWILDTGSTVTKAATTSSSSDIDSNTTKLWHMHLGHMSERGYKCAEQTRFLISRDVTFDESSMLSKKRELIDAEKDHGVREKVELEVQALDSLPIIPTDKEDGSHSTEENEEPQEQQYTLPETDREEIFDLLRSTVVVEKIFIDENPADMMTKHIPEIKFKHCLDSIGISSI